jgi:ABC-type nitrate/sulfonate/bicarbonate transport system substrate-binding protein
MESRMFTAAAGASINRRNFLRIAGLGGAAAGTGLLLSACGSSGSAAAASAAASASASGTGTYGSVGIQLSWVKDVQFAGEYFAVEKGYYKDAGFSTVNLLAGGGQTPTESVILAGQALVGMSSTPETAASVAQGAGLKIIAVGYQKNPYCLLSLKERTPITTVADLKGKSVGVSSDNQVTFEGFLKANNLTSSDVDIVATQYSVAPLEAGKYDAQIAFTTNEVITVEQDGYTPVVLPFADNGLSFATNPYFVTDDTLANKRDLLKALFAAEIRGWADAVQNPQQAAKYTVDIFGKGQDLAVTEQMMEAQAANALMVSADTNKNGLLTMTDSLISDTIASLKVMGTNVTAAQLFDFSLLQEVFQEHPDLIVKLPVTAVA